MRTSKKHIRALTSRLEATSGVVRGIVNQILDIVRNLRSEEVLVTSTHPEQVTIKFLVGRPFTLSIAGTRTLIEIPVTFENEGMIEAMCYRLQRLLRQLPMGYMYSDICTKTRNIYRGDLKYKLLIDLERLARLIKMMRGLERLGIAEEILEMFRTYNPLMKNIAEKVIGFYMILI